MFNQPFVTLKVNRFCLNLYTWDILRNFLFLTRSWNLHLNNYENKRRNKERFIRQSNNKIIRRKIIQTQDDIQSNKMIRYLNNYSSNISFKCPKLAYNCFKYQSVKQNRVLFNSSFLKWFKSYYLNIIL